MYVLVVRDPTGEEIEYDLVGEVVLGRDPSADIQLPDPNVSRRHVRLFLEDGLCYVEDLGSSNGTLIGGEPVVGAVVLEPGTEVAIGPFTVFIEEPEGALAEPPVAGMADGPTAEDVGLPDDGATYAGPVPAGPEPADGEGTFKGGVPGHAGLSLGALEGLSGAALGQVFEVRPRTTVGRVPGNTIVVEDPSVSRQHAEIRLEGTALTLRDLGSSNGTYVDGQPITETVLTGGETIRFGDVEFRFDPGPGLAAAMPPAVAPVGTEGGTMPAMPPPRGIRGRRKAGGGGPDKRKKVLIGALAGVIALFVVGLALKGGSKPPPESQAQPSSAGPTQTQKAREEMKTKVFSLVQRAKTAMRQQDWAGAKTLLTEARSIDPIHAEARKLLRQVELETKMQRVFEDAVRKSELGEDDAALDLYVQIDPESYYYQRAKYKVRRLWDILLKRYEGECLGSYNAHRFKEAVRFCGLFMNLACQCPGSDPKKLREKLEKAERREKVKGSERWSCPRAYREWSPCAVEIEKGDLQKVAASLYPNPKLASVVLKYAKGDVDDALKEVANLRTTLRSEKDRELARELGQNIKNAQGKFREGQGLLLAGDPERAEEEWRIVLENDRRILPTDQARSFYRNTITAELSEAYAKRGFKSLNIGRYKEAFEDFMRGRKVDPNNARVKEGFQRLEQQAVLQMRKAVSCEEFADILAITLADPPSLTHRQAKEAAEQRGCRIP